MTEEKKPFVKIDADGWPLNFRPAGAPAGVWPHTPWWHCVLCDPYERVNVWSHFLPAVLFLSMGISKVFTDLEAWKSVIVFCFSATATHLASATTHMYPDDIFLEKLDHLGIVTTIMGTPISTLMARFPEESFMHLAAVAAALLVAAFFPPTLRTLSFGAGSFYIISSNFNRIQSVHLAIEVLLYAIGAVAFLRNKGHKRPVGLQDHHFLHYCGTSACFVHLAHLYGELHNRGAIY